jgi:hypothetical protein
MYCECIACIACIACMEQWVTFCCTHVVPFNLMCCLCCLCCIGKRHQCVEHVGRSCVHAQRHGGDVRRFPRRHVFHRQRGLGRVQPNGRVAGRAERRIFFWGDCFVVGSKKKCQCLGVDVVQRENVVKNKF